MSSTEQEHIELAAMANEMGAMIARAAEWNVLTRLQTMTGDGTDTDFALPSDYDRMVESSGMLSSNWPGSKLRHVTDRTEWLHNLLVPRNPAPADWTLLGGEVHFNPALADDETVKFYYVSNQFATAADLSNQAAFTADDDSFRLNERTLRLGIIWKWRASKGYPSDGDYQDYQEALAQDIARDKGPREIVIGRRSFPRGVSIAWPGVLGQG